jgi:hypothetical protein
MYTLAQIRFHPKNNGRESQGLSKSRFWGILIHQVQDKIVQKLCKLISLNKFEAPTVRYGSATPVAV